MTASLEGPEARILAEQMAEELQGLRVAGCVLHDVAGLQPSGLVNRDLGDFERLKGGTVRGCADRYRHPETAADRYWRSARGYQPLLPRIRRI
jgi:hypothetical protein